ncbi:fungal-specific transcription factor domain-containing protein [Daldinia vernicosa]|uniref:fungal-specific transcription factor domain-containing protein n=1 Tax=Daldinia vernicosa TaxID=114800 RepID=UPI002007B0DF|nr:fungal-specific transcription factor domain-containing protein [Daldinia vernicosa]KAI0844483.1 fungal-specific transcription factor domain-containing protein [Daldinia vernicosa]
MFFTFASTPSGSRSSRRNSRRSKVARACNYCRVHRVRCDVELPCSRCLANNIECVSSPPGQQSSENAQTSQDESIPIQEAAGPCSQPAPSSPVSSRPDGMDSTVGFMSKINAFCSTISQLSSDCVGDSPPPPYPSPDGQSLLNESNGPTTVLSRSQVKHLLDIYWARCHPLKPIVNRAHVDAIFETLWAPDGSELKTLPVVDGIIALCLNYLNNSGLSRRLLSLRFEKGGPSLAYFKRCLAATSQYAVFAEPSLECLQCYVLMILYLLDAGEHQPAYNMIGLALRIAQALDLHHGLPDSDPNAYLARRIWWTIIHLNFRCARLLGRPGGVQLADTTCPLPPTDEFTYHTRAIALTRATLAVTEALSRHPNLPNEDRLAQVVSRASALSTEVYRLHEWRDQQLRPALGRPLHVDSKWDSKETYSWISSVADMSPSRALGEIFLELQYYDEIIGLHRPFICFPAGLVVPKSNPQRDAHATTSLQHAIATVDLTHRIMSTTDVLCGHGEIWQWQWNALLTLIGFLMGYPFCIYAPAARHHVQLALEIFSAADPGNSVAVRAAAVTRSLCAKVDNLVHILKSKGGRPASPNTERECIMRWNNTEAPLDLSRPSSDELWSWVDTTDPNAWLTYTDGITGVLADFPNLPFGNEGFSPLP